MRRARRLGIIIPLSLIVAVLITMHACAPTFRVSPEELDHFFKSRKIAASHKFYNVGWREIHYVVSGDSTKPLVVFIHGSPGSLEAFKYYLADTSLTNHAQLVTTDRPGFGYSNFGNAEPSLQKQAEALKPILTKYKGNRRAILVGHSLGGPLIAKMAIDYPELVDGLIIVAGSIDPELEPNETWFRAPLATPFLSWILPRSFRASNEEIYHLKPELEQMLPYWKNIKVPVIVIQGMRDSLVPAANADFARKMLINAPVEFVLISDMDHFVPWSNPELIHDAILKMVGEKSFSAVK